MRIRDYSHEDYREFWDTASNKVLDKIEKIIIQKYLPYSKGWFIDLGCGFGRLLPVYLNDDRRIVLVDYAINNLEIASKIHSNKKIFYILANAYNLPFRDGVFGSGISIRLFQHINSPVSFLKEFGRIFHKNSVVLFTYVNKRSIFRILKFGLPSLQHNHIELSDMLFGTHPYYFSKIAHETGFNVQHLCGTGFIHQLTHSLNLIDYLIQKNKLIYQIANLAEKIADTTFGKLNLAFLQFILLLKKTGTEGLPEKNQKSNTLNDILACPKCNSIELYESRVIYQCMKCRSIYPKKGKIIDFRC